MSELQNQLEAFLESEDGPFIKGYLLDVLETASIDINEGEKSIFLLRDEVRLLLNSVYATNWIFLEFLDQLKNLLQDASKLETFLKSFCILEFPEGDQMIKYYIKI